MLVSVHGTQGYETPPETPESFEAPEGSENAEGSEGSQGFETPQGYEIPQCYETTAMSQEANQLSDDEIVRSWRFLLQEISTWIGTHLNGAAISDPNLLPAGLQDWMGGYGYIWLSYGHPPSFVIEKVLWSWLDATIFNKYFFGLPAELDEQLHDLEETMAQDGKFVSMHEGLSTDSGKNHRWW
jgi:hypothetical protein